MKKQTNHNETRSVTILGQLAWMLDCSLVRYLTYARPWCRRPYLLLGAVTRRLARDHEHHAGEIVRLLHARGHNSGGRTFPIEFTYYNNLSLEYLAPRILDEQQGLIAVVKSALSALADDYEVCRLLRKLLRSLREYAAILTELLAPKRMAPPARMAAGTNIAAISNDSSPRVQLADETADQPQTAA